MGTSAKRTVAARKTKTRIGQTFRALENGQLNPADVIRHPPGCLAKIRVYDVLRRFPKLSRDGAEKVLRDEKVWPLRTMGDLTEPEKLRILHGLPLRVRNYRASA